MSAVRPGYIASHLTDNVNAMQGVRPFCGLIPHFFPQKYPAAREYISEIDHWTVNSAKRYNFNFKASFFDKVPQGFHIIIEKTRIEIK